MLNTYYLQEINERAQKEPAAFIADCEKKYADQLEEAAILLAEHRKDRPILLLNGPSSAGKTTTANRLCMHLEKHGVHARTISMDDYYLSRDEYTVPMDEENGVPDLESPLCMDLPLLSDHLVRLAQGEEICMPRFDFPTATQHLNQTKMRLEKNEIAIIEGIHSFNDVLTGALDDMATSIALRLNAQVKVDDSFTIAPEILRFARRALRDSRFRNSPIEQTVRQWLSIRRGERLYIAPFVHQASMTISTYLPYESCILYPAIRETLQQHADAMRTAELDDALRAADLFAPIDYQPYMPDDTLLREFVG